MKTWLEQYSDAMETFSADSDDVSVREHVGRFVITLPSMAITRADYHDSDATESLRVRCKRVHESRGVTLTPNYCPPQTH